VKETIEVILIVFGIAGWERKVPCEAFLSLDDAETVVFTRGIGEQAEGALDIGSEAIPPGTCHSY